MKKQVSILSFSDDCEEDQNIELPRSCPRCGVRLLPTYIYGVLIEADSEQNNKIFILNYCSECGECFISSHVYDIANKDGYIFEASAPLQSARQEFSSAINALSPDFVSIYNDSYFAESLGMTSICGMGYRKSMEFLIKDYIIYKNLSAKADVSKTPLMQCIKKYINDDRLCSLATASTWLGNDETHYVKRHTNYSLVDLRKFINAFVTFIDADLAYEEAKSLSN